jgi:hypothetical protein
VAKKHAVDPETDWVPARLIPSGKMNQTEQERRASSVLLAVMPIVPSFTRAILSDLRAPGGKQIATYTEVRLKDRNGRVHIPDGAICIKRGKKTWTCLVEVKTGTAPIKADQLERYLEIARLNDFDAVLTISNQIRSDPKELPYKVNKVKVGKLQLTHISWWRILTEAIIEHRFRGVSDTEQAWVLNELIRYLDDPKSGAGGLEGMGDSWVKVRQGARHQTLRATDEAVQSVAARWQQFVEYLCLHLSQELGVDVKNQKPRGKSTKEQVKAAAKDLADEGVLSGAFRVPEAVGPIEIEANLRTRHVTTTVELPAPKDVKRPQARVNWLLRQLKEAPDDLRLEARFANTGRTASTLLEHCRDDPDRLLLEDDSKRQPRAFVVGRSLTMGSKNGLGQGSFIGETRKQAADFYRDLVQDLSLPRPKAPKLPKEKEPDKPPPSDDATETASRRDQRKSLEEIGDLGVFADWRG